MALEKTIVKMHQFLALGTSYFNKTLRDEPLMDVIFF